MDQVVYDLHDAETGGVYRVLVKRHEVNLLDIDHKKRFRLLSALKAKGQKPVDKWNDSLNSSGSSVGDVSMWTPTTTAKKCTSKVRVATSVVSNNKVADWKGDKTTKFLQCCKQFREVFRKPIVKVGDWENVAAVLLTQHNLVYSPDQLREKMRNLKRYFNDAKRGLHGGVNWICYAEMSFIFDSLLEDIIDEDGDRCVPPVDPHSELHEVLNQSLNFEDGHTDDGDDLLGTRPLTPMEDCHVDNVSNHLNDDKVDDEPTASVHDTQEHQRVLPRALDAVRSPPAKKTSSGSRQFPGQSPGTPKRKSVRKGVNKVWPIEATNALVKECVARKAEVQMETVPLRVWRDISSALLQKDLHGFNWDDCRAKFLSMNLFFTGSLLQVKGMVGGVLWPYYRDFCFIHDVPQEYEVPPDLNDNTNEQGNGEYDNSGKKIWTGHAEDLLLAEYERRRHYFTSTKSCVRHSMLYSEIAKVMNDFNVCVTWLQCKSHMDDLISKFRLEYDNCNRTGAAPSTWGLYDRMFKLFEGSCTLTAPFSVSVGRGLTYSVGGNDKQEECSRLSRSRPPGNQNQNKANAKSSKTGNEKGKGPIYKSWQHEMEEKKMQQRKEMYEDMKASRAAYESRADVRMQVMKDIAAAMLLRAQAAEKK